MTTKLRAILFDLDGTLADTAPDLTLAVNRLLEEHGRPRVPLARTRAHTSSGARGMIGAAFGHTPDHADFPRLRERFLELYERGLCEETVLFPGMGDLLTRIEESRLAWGVVTNKAARFTDPLMRLLRLDTRAGCIVSGDTTPKTKPHPEPLLHAARMLDLPPASCLYVGDDLRDIQAARAAGMSAIAARYGYLGEAEPPERWGADAIVDAPIELWPHIEARL